MTHAPRRGLACAFASRAVKTVMVVAAVAAVSTIGSLAGPANAVPPTPLSPPCAGYQFKGPFKLNQDNGNWVTFTLDGKTFPKAGVPALGIVNNDYWNGKAYGGNSEGQIVNGIEGNKMGFTIYWEDPSRPGSTAAVGDYFGSIDDAGFVTGATHDKQGGRGSDVGWRSENQLSCINWPAPPPKDDVLKPDVVNECVPGGPCAFGNPPAAADSAPQQGGQPAQLAAPKLATVNADVDIYNAKNEPNGAGKVVGILRAEPRPQQVELVGDCAPESWCQVKGPNVAGGQGWVWGHLNLP
jgi:hypothetical protein